jgi:ribosomal protein S16
MYKIRLRKKSATKTTNNSYDILLKKNKTNRFPIGGYNQEKSTLKLDLDNYLIMITKGCNFSENFKKIFSKSTGSLINKKKVKIKF